MTDTTKTTAKTSKVKAAIAPKTTSEAVNTTTAEQASGLALITLYEGTKQVKARPMNRADYNAYRGWTVPADENPDDEGYLVEYLDGGKSNHPDHAGYISWSPKDVFERAYKAVPYTNLPPHQQRVAQEVADLTDRADKLDHFINHNPVYRTLSLDEQGRMSRQLILMKQLQAVLNERVAAF